MAGKKKHKLRKQHQKDPDQDSYSSGEDSLLDSSVKPCQHLTKSISLPSVKKILKLSIDANKCQHCHINDVKVENTSVEDSDVDLSLWLCLQCGNIGCGRNSDGRHALAHYKAPRSDCHAVCLNLSSWNVWCYECDEDIVPDSNKKLLECVEFIKKHIAQPISTSNKQITSSDLEMPQLTKIDQKAFTEVLNSEYTGVVTRSKFKEEARKQTKTACADIDNLLKVKGLVNLGNTCFFNAVMQSLSQTHILSRLLDLQCIRETTLTLEKKGPEIKATDVLESLEISLSEGGPLTQSMATFLKEMSTMGRTTQTVNPGHLFGQVCKKAPQFRGMMQQDSHELLRHLLDGLKSEEIKRFQAGVLKAFNLQEKVNPKHVDAVTRTSIKSYGKLVQQTLVDQIFSGQLISTVQCEECKMSSQVFEPFLDLSLPVMEEKPIRPSVGKKNTGDDDENTGCFGKLTEKPSKHQEKKAKKQAKRDAKQQKNRAKQQRRKTISIGDATVDDLVRENGSKDVKETDADSINNSIETKNGSELSDADVEDNAESGSISSLNTNAPAIVGGKKLTDDDCWPRENVKGEPSLELPFPESVPDGVVDNICLQVASMKLRQDSLSGANEIMASDDEKKLKDEDWKSVNGEIAINGHDHETDEMWSSSDEDGPNNGNSKKLVGHSLAKKEWMSKSLSTLSPRYQVSSHECSVLSCLNQFTAPELLTGNNKFGCENCARLIDGDAVERTPKKEPLSSAVKKEGTIYTNASKQLLVFSPPAILTLHLKRFQQVGFSLRKVNRHIDFPLTLDLAPYCSLVCLGLPTLKKGQLRVLYSLYAVVEHSGRLSGGHYTAYVKVRPQMESSRSFLNEKPTEDCDIGRLMDQVHEKLPENNATVDAANKASNETGRWYHVSDGHVSESSESSVLKCQAYLLFYERVV